MNFVKSIQERIQVCNQRRPLKFQILAGQPISVGSATIIQKEMRERYIGRGSQTSPQTIKEGERFQECTGTNLYDKGHQHG